MILWWLQNNAVIGITVCPPAALHSKSAVSLPAGVESKQMNQPVLPSRLAVSCCSKGKTESDPVVTATAILKITVLGNAKEDEKICFSISNENGSR